MPTRTITINPFGQLRELLVFDSWRAVSQTNGELRPGANETNLVESLILAIQRFKDEPAGARIIQFLVPDFYTLLFPLETEPYNFFNTSSPGVSGGYLRVGQPLAIEINMSTGNNRIQLPGFLAPFFNLDNLSIDSLLSGTGGIIDGVVLNLSEGIGDIQLSWVQEPEPGFEIRIEAGGDMKVNNKSLSELSCVIRFIPRVEFQRLLWSPHVELNMKFSNWFIGLFADWFFKVSERLQDGAKLLAGKLYEWSPIIMHSLLSLPLLPLPDENGIIILSELDFLDEERERLDSEIVLAIIDLLSNHGIDLETEKWGDFSRNFINSCIVPSNSLRQIIEFEVSLSGINFFASYARITDHFLKTSNIQSNEIDESAIDFEIQPYRNTPVVDMEELLDIVSGKEHDNQIVEREKYNIFIDAIEIKDPNWLSNYRDSDSRFEDSIFDVEITLDSQVRHENFGEEWATLTPNPMEFKVRYDAREPVIIFEGEDGKSVDWLETGGNFRLDGNLSAKGESIPLSLYYGYAEGEGGAHGTLPRELNSNGILPLRYEDARVKISGWLEKLTSINGNSIDQLQLDVVRLEIEKPYLDGIRSNISTIPEEIPFPYTISSLFVKLNLNGQERTARLTMVDWEPIIIEDAYVFSVNSPKNLFRFLFQKNREPSVEVRISLGYYDSANDFVEYDQLETTILKSEWSELRLGEFASHSATSVSENLGGLIEINNLSGPPPPCEQTAKPYLITLTELQVHDNKKRVGKSKIRFTLKAGIIREGESEPESWTKSEAIYNKIADGDTVNSDLSVLISAPVGAQFRVQVEGKALIGGIGPRRVFARDRMLNPTINFGDLAILQGNDLDTTRLTEVDSREGDDFSATVSINTAEVPPVKVEWIGSLPPDPIFGTNPSNTYLLIIPAGEDRFRFGCCIPWAETVVLKYSSDGNWFNGSVELGNLMDDTFRLEDTEEDDLYEFSGTPDFDFQAGFYRVEATNVKGTSASTTLEVRISD